MRTAIFTLFLILYCSFGQAQEGIVTIEQDQKITKLLDIYKQMNANAGFFTIQIGFGSYDTASLLKSDASIDYPQYNCNIIFDSPTYRVHLGRFKTKLEVERIFNEVRKKYPESIILKPLNANRQ